MYLTYDEYTSLGGTAAERDFIGFELKARKRIDYLTLERVRDFAGDDFKKLVFELIEMYRKNAERDINVSGYGNDGVSVSYVSPEAAKADFDAKADELITSVLGNLCYRGLGSV